MPTFPVRDHIRRWGVRALVAALSLAGLASLPATAAAKHSQIAIIQDGSVLTNPAGAMQQFRALGATTVRVIMFWDAIAPKPTATRKPRFNATDPNAYAAKGWAPYDAIVEAARADGLTVDFTVSGGAPRWAEGSGIPGGSGGYIVGQNPGAVYFAWKPNAAAYGQFMQAVGKRYDGSFTPSGQHAKLPKVNFWALWNEPNFGEDLGPQATDTSRISYAPMLYRNLVSAGYNALHKTGHGRDTILIGEFAAHGSSLSNGRRIGGPQGLPGNAGQTKPLQFIRTLYCLSQSYQKLTGSAAKSVGCPTTRSASNRFRSQNPGLFNASGIGDHAYANNSSPAKDAVSDPDFATFPNFGRLATALDRANRAYGSGRRYAIYNDEYGYITNPPNNDPKQRYVSQSTASYYLNWAEYLSWRNSRVASYDQYLLDDPVGNRTFASGLYTSKGVPKATLDAFRLPLYLPRTSFSPSTAAEVWGAARPAHWTGIDTRSRQSVQVQLKSGHGPWKTVTTVRSNGYFDIHQRFGSSGSVRLSYTYPMTDPFLPLGVAGSTITSRSVSIRA